jgi:hypothetical protein
VSLLRFHCAFTGRCSDVASAGAGAGYSVLVPYFGAVMVLLLVL